jgi:SOUL heme-binding protein
MAIEEPKYALALKEGMFELRDYPATVVAEVRVTGDQASAGKKGFRLLAGYIFGGNKSAQKIAMTVPVSAVAEGEKIAMTAPVSQIKGTGDWLVRFTMPARYALADLPVPNAPDVKLRALPPARFAVLRFSGLAGAQRVAERTALLVAGVKARALVPEGPVTLARYNPPWTPWFLRRNEVMMAVAAGV